MRHSFFLLKYWPKNDELVNLDPVIYCFDDEFDEERAKADLKVSEKEGYISCLMGIDGFDTFEECLQSVDDSDSFSSKVWNEKNTNVLMYKGKSYYFPRMILCAVPESNRFSFLFNLRRLGE